MSAPSNPPVTPSTPVAWADQHRKAAFTAWLDSIARRHGLLPATLRPASADASFRRYLRIDVAPTLDAGPPALPPEGAGAPWGGPAAKRAPTLDAGASALPPEGAVS